MYAELELALGALQLTFAWIALSAVLKVAVLFAVLSAGSREWLRRSVVFSVFFGLSLDSYILLVLALTASRHLAMIELWEESLLSVNLGGFSAPALLLSQLVLFILCVAVSALAIAFPKQSERGRTPA